MPLKSNRADQRTRRIDPMLVLCWTTVCDAGPTWNQHWVNAWCLLGIVPHHRKHHALTRDDVLMFVHRLQHLVNVSCLLGCKWNESGFRPPLCTYRLNWAKRTSWGWWDEWDETHDSEFEPWRSEAEHATSRSRRLPTILTFTRGWGRNIFVSFKPPRPGTEPRTLAWKAAVLTTTLGPPPYLDATVSKQAKYLRHCANRDSALGRLCPVMAGVQLLVVRGTHSKTKVCINCMVVVCLSGLTRSTSPRCLDHFIWITQAGGTHCLPRYL